MGIASSVTRMMYAYNSMGACDNNCKRARFVTLNEEQSENEDNECILAMSIPLELLRAQMRQQSTWRR